MKKAYLIAAMIIFGIGVVFAQSYSIDSVWAYPILPNPNSYTSCSDQIIVLSVKNSQSILWITDTAFTSTVEEDRSIIADTLLSLGYSITQIDQSYLMTEELLRPYGLVILGAPIGLWRSRDFSAAETLVFRNYVENGGNILSLIKEISYLSGDMISHNDIIEQFNTKYQTRRLWSGLHFPSVTHPITEYVDTIKAAGIWYTSSTSPAYDLLTEVYSGSPRGVLSINESIGSGKVAVYFDEQAFQDPIGSATSILEYDNMRFALNLTTWLCAGGSNCPIDQSSIDLSINGSHYSVDDGYLAFESGSLLTFTPTPPDTFEDGDSITVCLHTASDSCGSDLARAPVCWDFYVDLTPPVISNILPAPGSSTPDFYSSISFNLLDSLSGIDTSSIMVMVNGATIEPSITWDSGKWLIEWTPSGTYASSPVNICVLCADSTDYCEDNIFDTCWSFFLETNEPPSIDSVWFSEETDCNDSNIVHICYILSDAEGDPANISAQMSADSGATWTVPLTTLLNDTDDLGDSVMPGTHCFDWIMSEDLPDSEGYENIVRVTTDVGGRLFFVFIADSSKIYKHIWSGLSFGPPEIILSLDEAIQRVELLDVDNDGDIDLALAMKTSGNLRIYKNLGDDETFNLFFETNIFSEFSRDEGSHGYKEGDISSGFFNNDSIPDIVASHWTSTHSDSHVVLLGNGDGSFSTDTTFTFGWSYPDWRGDMNLSCEDIDSNGITEIYNSPYYQHTLHSNIYKIDPISEYSVENLFINDGCDTDVEVRSATMGNYSSPSILGFLLGLDDDDDPGRVNLFEQSIGIWECRGEVFDINPISESGSDRDGDGKIDCYDFDSDNLDEVIGIGNFCRDFPESIYTFYVECNSVGLTTPIFINSFDCGIWTSTGKDVSAPNSWSYFSSYHFTTLSSLYPLDSAPPTVAISCPTDTVFAGDTVDFHWTIDDIFWANDE